MPGGLMSLVSVGNQNIILNSNPNKTFWKSTYQKYTNFGLQHFRLDYEGTPSLRLTEESTFSFKVKRYADLLMDTYVVVNLPTIWSSFVDIGQPVLNPYEFKWIDNIGAQMISQITITCGSQILQQFSGSYLLSCVQRDFSDTKRSLFNEMIGHVDELNDPAKYNGGFYPNAEYEPNGAQPSIGGRTLYIPMNAWFNLKTQQAFPLVALQYNELQINVTFRPISHLFQIKDSSGAYIAPNFNVAEMQLYRFLQTPPIDNVYVDKRTIWNADIHLDCAYAFLSNDETRVFAANEQKYLIKQVVEREFYNVQNKVDLESTGLVSNWLFYFQRSDANKRNEWSNYSNWTYKQNPLVLQPSLFDPQVKVTGSYNPASVKDILIELGIVIDGQYRENVCPVGVYNYIEKYTRTQGNAPSGLYCYNFALNSSHQELQPSGAMNMSRHQNIQLEFTTIAPPLDATAQVTTICDPDTGEIIGINKPNWRIYEYNFNLYLFEERINVVTFVGGNAGLMYAM